MIHTVSIFLSKSEKARIKSSCVVDDNHWPLSVNFEIPGQRVQLHLSQEHFIKLKNEILSLDRQYDERRKDATVSKRS